MPINSETTATIRRYFFVVVEAIGKSMLTEFLFRTITCPVRWIRRVCPCEIRNGRLRAWQMRLMIGEMRCQCRASDCRTWQRLSTSAAGVLAE